jgi:DeoR family transcriptional regulator of aga operon
MKKKRNTLARRSEIIELLKKQENISVTELSKKYKVSEVSIRNDFAHLEDKGLLIRTSGGAISKQPKSFDLSLNQRLKKYFKEKQNIGKKATEFIKEGDTIVMDSGSTTLRIAENLDRFKQIKLITNSLPVAEKVADFKGVEVIIPGGFLRPEMRSLIGPIAEKNLLNYYCDIAFLAVDGIDCDNGFSTPVLYEATFSRTMIEISKKVIVVTDSSKFQRRSFVKIASMDKIDVIITDKGIPDSDREKIEKMNIELFLV